MVITCSGYDLQSEYLLKSVWMFLIGVDAQPLVYIINIDSTSNKLK